jgi:GntR family histidine utilization transcriptional repressor
MKTVARYLQVKNHILDGIRELRWSEGERVPSENQLVKTYDVSRMTARRALKELTSEGVLFSRQGQGTFVATAKSRSSIMTLRNIADEIKDRGHQHSCKILCLEQQQNESIAERFGLISNPTIYFSRIIHYENKIPIQLEERFVKPELAPEYLLQDYQSTTAYEYLMKVCPVSEAEHQVEALMPSSEQSNWLEMSQLEPCLKLTRTTWSNNQIASFAWLYHPGDRFQLGSHFMLRGNTQ